MNRIGLAAGVLGIAMITGCASTGTVGSSKPAPGPLPISTDELPEPGMCRFWTPGKDVAQQEPPFNCDQFVQRTPPPGGWAFKRLSQDQVYQIIYLKSGAVAESLLYNAKTGKYVGK
jgi:hypothetical protein